MSAVENRLLLGGVADALPETWHAGKPLDVRVRLMVMAWGNAFRVVNELESALDEVHEYQCGCEQPGAPALCIATPKHCFAPLAARSPSRTEREAE